MSDDHDVRAWFVENLSAFDRVAVETSLPAPEVRRRGVGRRQRRRVTTAIVVCAAVAAVAVGSWNAVSAGPSTVAPAHSPQPQELRRAQQVVQTYYSELPGALESGDAATRLSKLVAVYFSTTTVAERQVKGAGAVAATCGTVGPRTTFTVGVPRSTGPDRLQARVTSGTGADPVDVDVDARTLRITGWLCPGGS
ncbi:hypothetical protein ACUXZZ_44910 [Streptomyces graminifolii]|uniref:hypothetical protein n=1 Tax=Streptomyces graminifolii TaxID=1266771 RepID=UPI004058DEF4